jgi:hypothetical protein
LVILESWFFKRGTFSKAVSLKKLVILNKCLFEKIGHFEKLVILESCLFLKVGYLKNR